jgi:hypothetical protein
LLINISTTTLVPTPEKPTVELLKQTASMSYSMTDATTTANNNRDPKMEIKRLCPELAELQ